MSGLRPYIGITPRVEYLSEIGEMRDCLDVAWYNAVSSVGQALHLLPSNIKILKEVLREQKFKGIILSGGNDLARLNDTDANRRRDKLDQYLIQYCEERNLPLLGVCRGMQSVADFYGATFEKVKGHIGAHKIVPTQIKSNLVSEEIVNSFHHYSVSEINLPGTLIVTAKSEEGEIEAFKHRNKMMWAHMWHPERSNCGKSWRSIFSHLFSGENGC